MKYGLIGEKLGHSYSPQLHGLLGDYPYELCPLAPAELDAFLKKGAFLGLNVTIPYKQAVIPYCAEISEAARRIGSVNTLIRRADGSLWGDNTDAYGFWEMSQRADIRFMDRKVLVLGSGGTSRTACTVVQDGGGRPVVISRQGPDTYEDMAKHKDAAIIVNTTPVGMYPVTDAAPVDVKSFPRLEGVLDVVYNPQRTRLLQQAQALHLRQGGGLWMLVAQAARASQHFTGQAVCPESMAAAYQALRRQTTNLVLVGMPGCGKTTLGQRLAEQLNRPLTDIDTEIEKESGQSIPAIFATEGENGFRAREAAQIARFGREGGRVLVTGGGAVLSPENREDLRLNSFVVHITRPLEALPLDGRPLSQDRAALHAMWEKRGPLYAACQDMTVANEGTVAACAEKIVEGFNEALCH